MNTFPDEALVHIITTVITNDMRDICIFAFNKRIYTLADTLWRQVAYSSLIVFKKIIDLPGVINNEPCTVEKLVTALHSPCILSYGAPHEHNDLRAYLCADTTNRSDDLPYTGPIVLGVRVDDGSLYVDTCNYSATYQLTANKYKILCYMHRKITLSKRRINYTRIYDIDDPRVKILQRNLETILWKVLPEIAIYVCSRPY